MIAPRSCYFIKRGFAVCELLKTVSLLKSEITKEKTNPKKLITTNIS
jgi:hypothetical protein